MSYDAKDRQQYEALSQRYHEAVHARAGRLTERDAVNGTVALGDDWYMLVLYGSATYSRYGTGKVILRRKEATVTCGGFEGIAYRRIVDERVIEGDVAQAIIAAGEAGANFAMINMARGYLGLPDVEELPF